ncbi:MULTISPECIES: peptidylprolyl isomerase [Rhodococcus]|uniref:Peptidyl-prolyl cis-trans isomerase n=1 Tax=Rhodococcus rhodochrous J45 TaxID=935266 RepID=A0A562E5M7_RHORH|nr:MULTISPECIES: peptidylprolyl isomerase [Rhodococcus]OWY81228.1 peptidylprolyl isomerase [Rhodococcus sp. BUPNP1]TWH17199.1 peptidyl-prolyl cis-trans isomerase B (cyclophilin B) [Rhodococcus rhodochrous J45]BDB60344.1 putative peptidyl-prolyl cis-trans isomerase B [Rhodococcus sp. RDE2]
MPSNAQRRQAAKRKLERQLERRAERERKRRRMTIALSALAVIVVVGAGVALWAVDRGDDTATEAASNDTSGSEMEYAALPEGRSEPLPETVNCSYPADGREPSKPAEPPRTEGIRTTGEGNTDISVSVETSQGNIGLILHNDDSPCTVNSFLSLASQNFFDETACHRLTTSPSLQVLQCGDPSGSGSGGPGYQFANEFPTDQFAADDPAAQEPMTYPRGTLAMANAGPDTNGSQFFLVYGDSVLPPQYTVFGTIDETGLTTLDKIAAAGVAGGAADGAPALETTLTSVRMD